MIKSSKICRVCKEDKPLDEFYKKHDSPDGKATICKVCDGLQHKQWRLNNPERTRAIAKRGQLKLNYGITLQEYEDMLKAQNYVCAICNEGQKPNKVHQRLVIDHCHSSGEVRGLLCSTCNQGLGSLKDSYEILLKAARYLKRFNERNN